MKGKKLPGEKERYISKAVPALNIREQGNRPFPSGAFFY